MTDSQHWTRTYRTKLTWHITSHCNLYLDICIYITFKLKYSLVTCFSLSWNIKSVATDGLSCFQQAGPQSREARSQAQEMFVVLFSLLLSLIWLCWPQTHLSHCNLLCCAHRLNNQCRITFKSISITFKIRLGPACHSYISELMIQEAVLKILSFINQVLEMNRSEQARGHQCCRVNSPILFHFIIFI